MLNNKHMYKVFFIVKYYVLFVSMEIGKHNVYLILCFLLQHVH